ncbi:MAG: ComEC family competence protein [Hyphomonadaceae bacterium]|nr:ComEC family competence protein [Hyphomonadaceae bacterium]
MSQDLPVNHAVAFALSLAFGSAVYFNLSGEPSWLQIGSCVGTALLGWRLMRQVWALPWLALIGLIAFGLTSGAALAKWRTTHAGSPVILAETEPILVEGWVVAIDRGGAGPRLTLDVQAISGFPPEQTPARVRMTHMTDLEVSPGRFVRCYGVLRPPPAPSMAAEYDFQRVAWFRGLGGVGYVLGRCRGGVLGAPAGLARRAQVELASLRRQFAAHVNAAAGARAGGFAAALMSGDRSFMSEADAEALRGAGLAHLLAISGLHMGIVGGLVYLLMRRGLALIEPLAVRVPVQKPAALAALTASAAYLVISGASVSTQRAFIMAAILFGAILFDRAALSLRSFALAMIAVVALHPESVVTPGFQMSFAATGALIATYEAWAARRQRTENGRASGIGFTLKSLVVTSFVGAVSTAPFAVYHFGRVASTGLIANLAAMPIITFASAPLAAAALIAAPFGGADPVLRLFGYSLEAVLAIAHAFDGDVLVTGSRFPDLPATALLFFIGALGSMVALTGPARSFCMALLTVLGGFSWSAAPRVDLHWAPSGDVFLRTEAGYARVEFVQGDGLGPMRFADLEARIACQQACQIDGASGPVTFHAGSANEYTCGDLGEGIHLFREGEIPQCPTALTWQETQRLGGQTLRFSREGTILRERKQICQPRPWSPCRPTE